MHQAGENYKGRLRRMHPLNFGMGQGSLAGARDKSPYIAPDAICWVKVERRYLLGFTGVLLRRTS